jgi:hypothetical protein
MIIKIKTKIRKKLMMIDQTMIYHRFRITDNNKRITRRNLIVFMTIFKKAKT